MKKIIILLILIAPNVSFGQQKEDTSTYILKGRLSDFQLLYKSVTQPKDVTPNQQEAVADWIKTIKPEKPKNDSTKKKK